MRAAIRLNRRARVVLLATGLVCAFAIAGVSMAAAPVYPAVFTGPSAHGRYTVEVDSGCWSGNPDSCVPTASFLFIQVTTPKAFGKCPGNVEFQFTDSKIEKGGTFSATQTFQGNRTMTVKGRFTSARSVHGSVSGNQGCTASDFTIKLAAPFAPVVPSGSDACYWLDKAHASSVLGGASKPVGTNQQTYSPVTGLGRCGEWTHKRASTYYGARSYSIIVSQDTPDTSRGFAKKVAGLGPGATFVPNYYANAVFFRRGSAWVELYFEVPSANKPAASAITKQGKQLLIVAHRVYALMR